MDNAYKRMFTHDMNTVREESLQTFGVDTHGYGEMRIEEAVTEILNMGYELISVTNVGTTSLIYHFIKHGN